MKKSHNITHRSNFLHGPFIRSFKFFALLCVFINPIYAAWIPWNGSTSTDFEVGSNWTNGSVPANDTTSDNARFTSVPSNMPSLTSDRSIYGMDFTVGGVTVNGNYDLTLGNDGIDSSGSGTNVVNLNPIITGTWANWQIDSGNTLTVNGNLNGTSTELVLGSSSGGTINLNGSSNSYNSKINLRGNNHNRITVNVTGALNNLVHLKVGDKNNTTDNGKATLNLTGSNASIETSDKLFVGDRFEGIMNVTAGADVEVNHFTYIGNQSGANGTLNLDGAGTTFTQSANHLRIGQNNNATGTMTVSNSASVDTSTRQTYLGTLDGSTGNLTVQSGGTFTGDRFFIGNNDGGTGNVTVTGSGSTLTSDNKLYVGNNGTGTMMISNSADVTSTDETILGSSSTGTGSMTVTGSGSTLTSGNLMKIGAGGTGTLTIADSGAVSVTNNKNVLIADSSGSNGTLNVNTNSTLSSHRLVVGSQGTGAMTISGSADVTSADETIVGSTNTSNGSLTVTGSGSTLASGSFLKVGASGTGTMTIADSAAVTVNNNKDFYLGAASGSNGTLNVNTNATMSAYNLFVANSGTANMTVDGSADVSTANNVNIGAQSTGNGNLTVTGSGTTLTVGGELKSGINGTGSLTISDSAVVTVNNNKNMFVGQSQGSNGTLNVLTGATLNANKLVVANQGTGAMTISGGADVTVSNEVNLGSGSNGVGTMTVTGSGSTLVSGNQLKVGINGGTGTLEIKDSATVTVNNDRDTWLGQNSGSSGTLNVNSGATLNANKFLIGYSSGSTGIMTVSGAGTVVNASNRIQVGVNGGGGTQAELHIDDNAVVNDTSSAGMKLWSGGVLDFNGGTLNVTNNFGTQSGSIIKGHGVFAKSFGLNGVAFDGSAGQTLELSGVIWNGGTGFVFTKNGAGTLKLSNDNTHNRDVNVNAGTLLIEHEDGLGESWNNNANTTTTVANGATLALNNSSTMNVYEKLVISGTGAGSVGAVDVVDGSHTIAGTVTLAGNSTIDVSSSDDTLTFSQVVSGSSNTLTKTGAGALTLSNNNTYTGNTTVSQGTLNLTGSIDGNLVVNGGTATGGTNANAVSGALTLSSGAISPNTAGTRGVYNIKGSGTNTWTGGTYVWDVSGGMGSSGTDSDSNGYYEASGAADGSVYDILAFTGALDFNGSSTNSITIDVNSYGAYTGYHWETPTEIKIATAASISNFNESFFNIDSSGFNDAHGSWWLDWGITSHGNALWLTYNAVPETSTWVMILTLPLLILLKFLHYKKIQKKIPSED